MTFKNQSLADEVRDKWTDNHQHTEEKQLLNYLYRCLLNTATNTEYQSMNE